MSNHFEQPIYWHQGLFLQPHHLQYQDLKNRAEHYQALCYFSPWYWGVESIGIRESALKHEQLVFDSLRILWPDGALTDISSNAIVDSLNIKLSDFAAGPKTIFVGLRHFLKKQNNVGIYESMPEATKANFRHVITAEPQTIADYYSGDDDGQVSFMSYVLRLFWEDEIKDLSTYDLIPLVRLEQDGDAIKVSSNFIPPCLTVNAAPNLLNQLNNLHDGLVGRTRQLEIFKQPMHAIAQGTNSEQVYSILALSVLNRFCAELSALIQNAHTPPWAVHVTLKNLVAELSTFSEYCNFSGETGKGDNLIKTYQHNDIMASFSGLFTVVRRLLNDITLGPEMLIKFERSAQNPDIYLADLPMSFFGAKHEYYLIIRQANFSEELIEKIEREAKLDEQKYIDDLIKKYLPGLVLQHLADLPPGLPRRSSSEYFRISTDSREWNSAIRRRDVALFIPDAPADLIVNMIVTKR